MKKSYFNRNIHLIFSILSLVFLSTLHAQEKNFERIVNDSHVIVIGNVKSINSSWDTDKKNIWTYVTFEPKEFIKGKINSKEVVIKIPGGKVENIEEKVSGTPNFQVGEIALSFLGKENEKYYYVNGWNEGKFSYKQGKWIKNDLTFSDQLITKIKDIIKLQIKNK